MNRKHLGPVKQLIRIKWNIKIHFSHLNRTNNLSTLQISPIKILRSCCTTTSSYFTFGDIFSTPCDIAQLLSLQFVVAQVRKFIHIQLVGRLSSVELFVVFLDVFKSPNEVSFACYNIFGASESQVVSFLIEFGIITVFAVAKPFNKRLTTCFPNSNSPSSGVSFLLAITTAANASIKNKTFIVSLFPRLSLTEQRFLERLMTKKCWRVVLYTKIISLHW